MIEEIKMSYPFEYLHNQIWRTSKTAYVIHPFDGVGNDCAKEIVEPAVEEAKLEYASAKGTEGASPILDDILRGIAEAQIVIAVLSNLKPNVYWELGVAMTWKPATQILTVCHKRMPVNSIPFNVRGYRHVFLDYENTPKAVKMMKAEILNLAQCHNDRLESAVTSGRNSLGPEELDLLQLSEQLPPSKGHFILPLGPISEVYRQAAGNLCRMGLLACNTRTEDKVNDEKPNFEYSFYLTPVGNKVLSKLGLIESEEVKRRFDMMPEEIRNWRGGQVFSPV